MVVEREIPAAVGCIVTAVILSSGRPAVCPFVAWFLGFLGNIAGGFACGPLFRQPGSCCDETCLEWLDVTASRCASSRVSPARIPEHNL